MTLHISRNTQSTSLMKTLSSVKERNHILGMKYFFFVNVGMKILPNIAAEFVNQT